MVLTQDSSNRPARGKRRVSNLIVTDQLEQICGCAGAPLLRGPWKRIGEILIRLVGMNGTQMTITAVANHIPLYCFIESRLDSHIDHDNKSIYG